MDRRALWLACTALTSLAAPAAHAQSTWNGGTVTYTADANWDNNNAPTTAGESAIFANTGSVNVNVASVIAPDSWTFAANAQSYTISGSQVNFSNAATVTNNATAGTITISNSLLASTLSQAGAGALVLNGNNSFILGASVTAGTLQVNAGATLAASGQNNGTLVNNGTLAGSWFNDGTMSTTGTINGNLTGLSGTISAAGTINGNLTLFGANVNLVVTGALVLNGSVTNIGTGFINVAGGDLTSITTLTNNWRINVEPGRLLSANEIVNSGGLISQPAEINSRGTLSTTSLTNSAIVNAEGNINGIVNNNGRGRFITTGALVGNGSAFNNNDGAALILNGSFTGIGALTNNSSADIFGSGIEVRSGQLGATSIVNSSGASIRIGYAASVVSNTTTNDGTIANDYFASWTGDVTNTGSIFNNPGVIWTGNLSNTAGTVTHYGTWTGAITNAGLFTNISAVNGDVTNSGTYRQTAGATNGGVTNTGTVSAEGGAFNGAINNSGAGVFNVIGSVTGNGSAFNNTGTATLNVAGGSFTSLGAVTNASTALAGINVEAAGTLGATSIVNSTGAIFINNGTVNTQLTVNGGTIGGNGTFVGNSTFNGGNLAPGNSIGPLTFQGNLTLTAASTYLLEVDPNGSDLTNVTGTVTLGGATVSATYANGSYITRRYTILSATGGVIGTFNTLVNTNLPSNFTSALSYDANNTYLDLTLTLPNSGGLSGNQANVAAALIRSFNTAGGIPLAFGALTPQGLTQVSGESATGTQQTTFDAMGQFASMLTDPFHGERGMNRPQGGTTGNADEAQSLAYAARRKGRNPAEQDAYVAMARKAPPRVTFERRWSVWGAGYGGTQSTDGDAAVGSNDVRSRIYGGAAGFDYRVTPDTLIGFALGGAGTKYNLANGLGGGSSEMFQAGIYGRHNIGAAYLAGALAYGWQDVTTDRNVLLNQLRANFDANAISGRLEGGYRFAYGMSGITPYAAGQFTTFFLPAYAEQVVAGTNLFALAYAEKDVTASRSELGLRADTSFAYADAIVTLRGRAAWAHNFNTDRSISAIFQTLPASAFVVNGAAQAHDSALVTASAETKWLNGFSVATTFEGEFSSVTDSYAGKGVVRYQW